MTYSDLSKHSQETQAAVDQEVRNLLQVPVNHMVIQYSLLIALRSAHVDPVHVLLL